MCSSDLDYVGDPAAFEREFSDDVAVLAHARRAYGLPAGIKLSVHSGSDKFTLYPPIRRVLGRTGAGVHVKTAGTTWLEELIGLAEAGGEGLDLKAAAAHLFHPAAHRFGAAEDRVEGMGPAGGHAPAHRRQAGRGGAVGPPNAAGTEQARAAGGAGKGGRAADQGAPLHQSGELQRDITL